MSELEAQFRERRLKVLVPLAERLQKFIEGCLKGAPRIDRVATRVKGVDRFVQKALKKKDDGTAKYSDPLSQIQDQIGARIVTFYLSDVEFLSTQVDTYFRAIEWQSIIPESPNEFGYIGKHYILFVPSDIIDHSVIEDTPKYFELQIKTLFQHAWSEAEHDLGYKPSEQITHDQKRKIAFTAAQAWGADHIFDELHHETSGGDDTAH